ncbi:uncharacterized protein LOC130764819 [Actinidia eriantha]|uniref:uncharacterized protein LOC130764819 n=1 Tax=Actinidia eriantha TaxID=165200 RepID=UPI0025908FDA|nr:uncharacterized protein LOC130764819 [Actinidia eriantha]
MADFSFLSDSSDHESAVEELLSQAMDHSVLEQVAAINCSAFTSDSVLPTHLETRFHKLKSFPATNPKPSSSFNSHSLSLNPQFDKSLSDDENGKKGLKPKLGSGSSPSKSSNSSPGNAIFSPLEENPDGKSVGKSKSRSGLFLFPSSNAIFSPSKTNPDGKLGGKLKSRSGSFLSPSDSSNLFMESPSPPQKSGCFWCSPKRVSRKKSNREKFLSDLGIFSEKEQQKILKKAMKEEEKINREAEKIVKWAKQTSARMNISDIEDELSDNENPK